MNATEQIAELLEQLYAQTGISFSIQKNNSDDEETISILKNMLHAQYGSTSKEGFFRSLLLGALSSEELLQGARRFHIDRQVLLFPMLIEGKQPFSAMELSVFSQFFSNGADTLIPIDDCHFAILRQLKQDISPEAMFQEVCDIRDTLEAEAMISLNISYDRTCESIDHLAGIFLNISTAMEIGKMFYSTQHIFWSHDLGMGKLIYNLPKDVCEEYIQDHFKGLTMDQMDEETLHTIHVFLESGLSIAECARNLYLHRNTLIYRLDKIQKLTGLDIRKFDDAMTCKVALMMSSYLD